MDKFSIRLTQVYQINGRLVIANSLEDAVNTWREWMTPNSPDIRKIERVCNDTLIPGDDALVFAEGLCGDITNQYTDDIARLKEENAKLKYELDKADAFIKDLNAKSVDGLSGAGMILDERNRQIVKLGYDDAHDRHHQVDDFIKAAMAYLTFYGNKQNYQDCEDAARSYWPFEAQYFKPGTLERNLVKAGALVAAAIDRLNQKED